VKDIWGNETTWNTKNTQEEPTSDAWEQPAVKDMWGNEVTWDSVFGKWNGASPISSDHVCEWGTKVVTIKYFMIII
jgi:hypothetical protein